MGSGAGPARILRSAVEWLPFKHVGFGFDFNSLDLNVESKKSDCYPGVDFSGISINKVFFILKYTNHPIVFALKV